MFSCVSVCVFAYYIYVFIVKTGVGVMDLDYGSSSSLDMNCEVNFVCVMPIRLYRVRLTQCSCVDVSSLDLIIHGCTLYGSSSSRMSTRRLPVILFVSRFEYTLYPVMYCLECLWWPRRFVINLRLQAYRYLMTFSNSFHYYPPPTPSIGYPSTLPLAVCYGCGVH